MAIIENYFSRATRCGEHHLKMDVNRARKDCVLLQKLLHDRRLYTDETFAEVFGDRDM